LASVLFTEAVKRGLLSIVLPTQAAVPVFSLLTLWIGWSETPSLKSILLMIISMACLAYSLSLSRSEMGNRGSGWIYGIYSIIAAVLFGICTILDRVAIIRVAHGALAYSACWNLVSAGLMGIQCFHAGVFKTGQGFRWRIGPLGLYSGAVLAAFYAQQYAVQLSLSIPGGVVHVKSIVMLHLPAVMIAGFFILGETLSPRARMAGILALITGWLLIRDVAR
jgi:drug/metabolite transporter (DMT)-like permease